MGENWEPPIPESRWRVQVTFKVDIEVTAQGAVAAARLVRQRMETALSYVPFRRLRDVRLDVEEAIEL